MDGISRLLLAGFLGGFAGGLIFSMYFSKEMARNREEVNVSLKALRDSIDSASERVSKVQNSVVNMKSCSPRVCTGPQAEFKDPEDWTTCKCEKEKPILRFAGCDSPWGSALFRVSTLHSANTWVCGGHGTRKVVTLVCCAE